MKVKIKIKSNIGGGESVFRTHGTLTFTPGGFSAEYRLDGDNCLIEYDGLNAVQRRSGHLTFIMQFSRGERTECVLLEGGTKFSFPIFTQSLSASVSEEGCTLRLVYLQGEERERTEVLFSAEHWREREQRPQINGKTTDGAGCLH